MTFNTSHILSISFILHKYTSILECFLDVLLFGQFQTCSIRYKRLLGYLFIYGSVSPGREFCPFFFKKYKLIAAKLLDIALFSQVFLRYQFLWGLEEEEKKCLKFFWGVKKLFCSGVKYLFIPQTKRPLLPPKHFFTRKYFLFLELRTNISGTVYGLTAISS